jgi:hypothetical protein
MSKKPVVEPKVVEDEELLELIDNFITQKYLTEELFDVKGMSFKKDLTTRIFELAKVTVNDLPEGGLAFKNPDDHENFLIFLRRWSSRSVSWKSAYESLAKYVNKAITEAIEEFYKTSNDPIANALIKKLLEAIAFDISCKANSIPGEHETIHDDAPMVVVKSREYTPTTKQISEVIDNAEIFMDDRKSELAKQKEAK